MLKRTMTVLVVLLFFSAAGVTLAAGEDALTAPLTPADLTYDTGLALEDAQYRLTGDFEEQCLMQNEFAERRLQAMEEAENPVELEALQVRYRKCEQELARLWEGAGGSDAARGHMVAQMAEFCRQRALRLQAISENESLPMAAREGMKLALENQEMAMHRFNQLLSGGEQFRETTRTRDSQENEACKAGDKQMSGPSGQSPGSPSHNAPDPSKETDPGLSAGASAGRK